MADQGDAKTQKGGKKNLILVVVLVLGLFGGVFAGKTFFGGKSKEKEKPKVGHSLELGEFIMNLAGEDHFLKVEVELGLREGVSGEKLREKVGAMRDVIVMALSSKRRDELNTLKGKEEAKEKIREKINHILEEITGEKEAILEVYFTSFAMQG